MPSHYDQVISSNHAAKQRAAAFPGGSVRPSQMPLGRGAPGPRATGEQVVVRAGIAGANPTESPAGAPGGMVGPAMRPGQFGAGGTAPRQPAVSQNGQRAADIVNGNGGGAMMHTFQQRPLLWAGAAVAVLFFLTRRRTNG